MVKKQFVTCENYGEQLLRQFKTIMAVYCENYAKHINTSYVYWTVHHCDS